MKMDGAVVRDSELHGRGLFAVQHLPALTRVAVYGGHRKLPHHVMRRRKADAESKYEADSVLDEEERWVELPSSTVIAKLRYLINSYDDAWVLDPTGTVWGFPCSGWMAELTSAIGPRR
jgi:hypothetical protein